MPATSGNATVRVAGPGAGSQETEAGDEAQRLVDQLCEKWDQEGRDRAIRKLQQDPKAVDEAAIAASDPISSTARW